VTEYLANQLLQYLPISLTDGAVPCMDIGLLVAGQLWRLQRGTAYGVREGRVMLDRRDGNPYTGAEFPVPANVNLRMAAFTPPALSTGEARIQHRDMLRRLGAARDTLWIAGLVDSTAERSRRAIWGAMVIPPFLVGFWRRNYSANCSFWASVMLPMVGWERFRRSLAVATEIRGWA